MTYLNAKKYISAAPVADSSNNRGEGRIEALLNALGAPQRRMKYLRLAGSNGKTVCAEMLMSVMKKASYTVGCLRMPVREEPRENICIGLQSLSMDDFAKHTSNIRQLSAELCLCPTRSEILLAIALCAFRDAGCNFCIIESDHFGDDPSRLLPPPFAAVICGAIPNNDTAEISRIRSYICRGISEIVSVPQNSDAYRIISDTCYSVNCRLTLPSKNAISVDRLSFGGTDFTYKGRSYSLNLCGRFQVSNAVLLLEIVDMLTRRGYKIEESAVRAGLSELKIPSKFEVVSVSPLIIIDSTHTPVAIETVCDSFADFKRSTASKVRLCLPRGEIIRDYEKALEKRGYSVERIVTQGDTDAQNADNTVYCKTPKAIAKAAIEGLGKDTVLLVSGNHTFVSPVRYELLAIFGF